MPKVVCIHGIAQEYELEESLLTDWAPRLSGAVKLAGGHLDQSDIRLAFYGVLFRPTAKSAGIPNFAPGDVEEGFETELLEQWDAAAAAAGPTVGAAKGAFGRRTAASMLQVLGQTPFFGNVAQKVVIWFLKQVHLYLRDPEIRKRARQSVLDVTGTDTTVYVAHSLGSVVAYEVLCADPTLPVRTLVTIGSPLGLPPILSRLQPAVVNHHAQWPGGLQRWTNIADAADMVALVKELAPVFGKVVDLKVHNGATMHDSHPYLTAIETGQAVLAGL